MENFVKGKILGIICMLCIGMFCFPQSSAAQRDGNMVGNGNRASVSYPAPSGSAPGGGYRPAPVASGFRPSAPSIIHSGPARRGGGSSLATRPVGPYAAPPAHHVYTHSSAYHSDWAHRHPYRYHPYYYHPYRPYFWGSHWHPCGYFAARIAADAFFFSWADQSYYYDEGVYYQPSGSGYTVVSPPIGAVVNYLPPGYEKIQVADAVYYYYAGTFYVIDGEHYRVVAAPEGAIVTHLPEGAAEQEINGIRYLLYNNTCYRPVSQDGQDAYQVVRVNGNGGY